MNRREFVIRSTGIAGAMLGGGAVVAAAAESELAKACAAIAAGESANFALGGQTEFDNADLAWQTNFHHDDRHGLIHLMGKPANANRSWHHQQYNIADNKWTVVARGMWNNFGHIHGSFTIDHATGDLFQWRGGMDSARNDHYRRAGWWKYETKMWGYVPVDIFDGTLASHPNGGAFHPNLYGNGDGGLILGQAAYTLFWRKRNDAVENIPHERNAYGPTMGVGVYWPAKDVALMGGSRGGALLQVSPNGGRTPTVRSLGVPPIGLAGDSHITGRNFGSLHVHPANPDKLLIVETIGPRAWTSTNGTDWTQIDNHPFTEMPRVICSLRGGLGALWCIARSRQRHASVLWKPKA